MYITPRRASKPTSPVQEAGSLLTAPTVGSNLRTDGFLIRSNLNWK